MTASPQADGSTVPKEGAGEPPAPDYSFLENACRLLSQASILILIGVVALDILTRSLLDYSFEIADEIGGYLLVCIAFFSLSVCQAHDGFHRVEFVMDRLSPRAREIARMVYDLMALAIALVLVWYLAAFVSASWTSGSAAPTRLATPLWIAQVPMVLGLLAYILSIVASLSRHLASLRSQPGRPPEAPHGR
ncbi:MAG: hypothetical protein RIS88_2337 [Pseudomonadota bacterium]|jgi:TRAP-type C4-dicarboxylate transport system permease small subunit